VSSKVQTQTQQYVNVKKSNLILIVSGRHSSIIIIPILHPDPSDPSPTNKNNEVRIGLIKICTIKILQFVPLQH